MNIQEICDLIDENFYKENNYYLSINNPEEFAKQVALEFGKQCFDAALNGKLVSFETIMDFETFEDYLKSLENED